MLPGPSTAMLPACLGVQKGEGPIGVIVAPTRELAEQIHKETREEQPRCSRLYFRLCVCVCVCVLLHQQRL